MPSAETERIVDARPEHAPAAPALADFITSFETPLAVPGIVAALQPAKYSNFLLSSEADPGLYSADLRSPALRLRDEVRRRWQSGQAPLTIEQYLQLSLALTPHTGTALLLCHDVARAFARGSASITWRKIDRIRGAYTDGAETFTATVFHPKGLIRPAPTAAPSLFYLLFAPRAFGVVDPGHWRRFFGTAAAVWYTASAATVPDTLGTIPDPRMVWAHAGLAPSRQDVRATATAWRWANALSFCEAGAWARHQDQVALEARLARRAARFALSLASPDARDPGLPWHIPRARSLREAAAPPGSFADQVAVTLAPDDD